MYLNCFRAQSDLTCRSSSYKIDTSTWEHSSYIKTMKIRVTLVAMLILHTLATGKIQPDTVVRWQSNRNEIMLNVTLKKELQFVDEMNDVRVVTWWCGYRAWWFIKSSLYSSNKHLHTVKWFVVRQLCSAWVQAGKMSIRDFVHVYRGLTPSPSLWSET